MTRTQLKIIRARMGLTQAELAEKLKMARNSVARMESGRMIITPPMALLISFVAREAGVDAVNPRRGRKAAQGKRAHLRRLKLPRVKLGKQYRYRPGDIEGFINLHLEYPEIGRANVSRIQKKSKTVGLSVLPSRAMLQQIRLGQQNGGKTGGTGSAS